MVDKLGGKFMATQWRKKILPFESLFLIEITPHMANFSEKLLDNTDEPSSSREGKTVRRRIESDSKGRTDPAIGGHSFQRYYDFHRTAFPKKRDPTMGNGRIFKAA